MKDGAKHHIGRTIAHLLAGAWRPSPPPLSLSETDLADIVPHLIRTGAASLAWWRLRNTSLATTAPALKLRHSYRYDAIGLAFQETGIEKVLNALHAANLDPVLVKGWAVARRYPESGLRIFGDIDLIVSDSEQAKLLKEKIKLIVDFRHGVDIFKPGSDAAPFAELHARSQPVNLGDTPVRILSDEDHLRILCLHRLRGGFARPIWLCDIAVMLESLSENFDWDLFLAGSGSPLKKGTGPLARLRNPGKMMPDERSCPLFQRAARAQREWIACAIKLAHELLDARIDHCPATVRNQKLPSWLVPAVLRRWEMEYADRRLWTYLLQPRGLLRALAMRWPDPIEVSCTAGRPPTEQPRWPLQVAGVINKGIRALGRLAGRK